MAGFQAGVCFDPNYKISKKKDFEATVYCGYPSFNTNSLRIMVRKGIGLNIAGRRGNGIIGTKPFFRVRHPKKKNIKMNNKYTAQKLT